jgi:DNA helicase-2/ATP-dependent DNA helicase PcrA
LKELIKEYKGKSMAVICKSKKQASKLYSELSDFDNVTFLDIKNKEIKRGVVISGVSLVKGLEFDKVVVYGANDKNYSKEVDRNYFYIACSRAINELVILSENKFTDFLGDVNEKDFK